MQKAFPRNEEEKKQQNQTKEVKTNPMGNLRNQQIFILMTWKNFFLLLLSGIIISCTNGKIISSKKDASCLGLKRIFKILLNLNNLFNKKKYQKIFKLKIFKIF